MKYDFMILGLIISLIVLIPISILKVTEQDDGDVIVSNGVDKSVGGFNLEQKIEIKSQIEKTFYVETAIWGSNPLTCEYARVVVANKSTLDSIKNVEFIAADNFLKKT